MKTFLLFILAVTTVSSALAQSVDSPAFNREEIRFTSGHFELVGDLLIPPGDHPHPVIVYVWGSGPTNRNAHIDRSQILKLFLKSGFAVFLYDKPGSGSSTGEFTRGHLFEERAAILIDAIRFLKNHDAVDHDAIGLYGSSQASYVMAVALSRTEDIDFMIAWSCPMQNSIEQSAYLVRNYVLCDGGSDEEAAAAEKAYVQRGRARTYAEYLEAADPGWSRLGRGRTGGRLHAGRKHVRVVPGPGQDDHLARDPGTRTICRKRSADRSCAGCRDIPASAGRQGPRTVLRRACARG
jgi:alpha/beta superfamily hydrolase